MTLRCGPNVYTHNKPQLLEENKEQYPSLRSGLQRLPSNQSPERETHAPATATSYSQRPPVNSYHQLYNRPAGPRKWPRLHCNVCLPHDKKSTLASLQKTIDAPAIAVIFIDNIVNLPGVPQVVVSDCDVCFTADYCRQVVMILPTKLRISIAFHPETDGLLDNSNTTVVCYLHGFATHNAAN